MSSGLVHALQLDGQGGATFYENAQALALSGSEGGLLWLHFDYTDPEAQRWVMEESGLSAVSADALLAPETRPRVTPMHDGLLIYLRGVNHDPSADPEDMIAIRMVVQKHRIISTQKRGLLSVQEMLQQLRKGEGVCSASELVADLVDRLTWYMDDVVERIDADLDALEDQPLTNMRQQRRQIAETRRRITVLRRYLAPQREVLARLHAEPSGVLAESERMVVREAADRMQRLLEDLDMFRDHSTLAQEALDSQMSDQLSRRMYALAVISGMFLPLTFLTGLFGVNLAGIPGAEHPLGFAGFAGALAVLLVLSGIFLYTRKWF